MFLFWSPGRLMSLIVPLSIVDLFYSIFSHNQEPTFPLFFIIVLFWHFSQLLSLNSSRLASFGSTFTCVDTIIKKAFPQDFISKGEGK